MRADAWNRLGLWIRAAACATLWLALGSWAAPQAGQERATLESIEASITALEETVGVDEPVRVQVLDAYRAAQAALTEAVRWEELRAELERERSEAPAALQVARSRLAEPPGGLLEPLRTDAPQIEYDARVSASESRLEDVRREKARLDAEPQERAKARTELLLIAEGKQDELARVKASLAGLATSELSELELDAQRVRLSARRRALEAEIAANEEQLRSWEATTELLMVRRDLIDRDLVAAEALVEASRAAAAEHRRRETARAESAAVEAERQVSEVHPALRQEAQRAAQLAAQISDLSRSMAELDALREETQSLRGEVEDAHRLAEQREKSTGLTDAIGSLLRREKTNLPPIQVYRSRVASRNDMLAAAQLAQDELYTARDELAEREGLVRELLGRLPADADAQVRAALNEQARGILDRQSESVEALIDSYRLYTDNVIQLGEAERQIIDEIDSYATYIDERVLWIRSSAPLWKCDFEQVGQAFRWLVAPSNWGQLGRTLRRDFLRHPLVCGFVLIAFLGLLALRRRLGLRLADYGEQARKRSCTSLYPTLRAVVVSAFLIVAVPGFLHWLGGRLLHSRDAAEFVKAIGIALRRAALVVLLIQGMRLVWRPLGLGPAHFGWRSDRGKSIRKELWVLLLTVLPTTMVTAALAAQPNEDWSEGLGRITLISALVVLTVFLFRFRPREVRPTAGFSARVGRFFTLAVVVVPLCLALLAVGGYYFTAVTLADRLLVTILLSFGGVLMHGIGSRWLLVVRRRLAIEQAQERRRAALEASGQPESEVPLEVEAIDLNAVDAQSRQMLRSLIAVGLVVGAWLIWSDVLPALGQLKTVKLWSYTDGSEDVPVTLRSLIVAVVILVSMVLVRRNLAGVLEVSILRRLAIGAGERYAFTALARYLVTLIGLVWAFGALGVGWSKVQWLLAAVSVGLGFGLQEIFANFVSGLIILAERPIRVGDWVTVAGIDGKVTRILMRATTIMDRDRKELVVPNKAFVTDQLINWTLSDPVTRVILPVGVAYGSDTDRATEVLLEVAKNNRDVLADPAPNVIFRSFDDSALGMELRVFIGERDLYPAMLHPLNTAIHKRFMEEGIEIAFPQRDLHIRSTPTIEPLGLAASEGAKTEA